MENKNKLTRYGANMGILHKLQNFFTDNPDIRFFQGLQILKLQNSIHLNDINHHYIEDNFNEESVITLNKIV